MQAEEDPGDIILIPPDDCGDENEINIHHLSSSMLRSQIEVQNIPVSEENRAHDQEANEEEIDLAAPKKKKRQKTIL